MSNSHSEVRVTNVFTDMRRAWGILGRPFKIQAVVLVFLMALAACLDIISLGAIVPFLAVLSDPELSSGSGFLSRIYTLSHCTTYQGFSIFLALMVSGMAMASAICRIYLAFRLQDFIQKVGTALTATLFKDLLLRDYVYFMSKNMNVLSHILSQDALNVVAHVVHPSLNILSNTIILVILVAGLIYVDPVLAFSIVTFFFLLYFIIFRALSSRLKTLGNEITDQKQVRHRLISESLSAIKSIKSKGMEWSFFKSILPVSFAFERAEARAQTLNAAPRYISEAFGITLILCVAIYFLVTKGSVSEVIPLLVFYVLAAAKILPTAQQIYGSLAQIRFGSEALNQVCSELSEKVFPNTAWVHSTPALEVNAPSVFESIELKNVAFSYPGSKRFALKNIDCSIFANKTIGIVGSSGAGKSTFGDLLLGILKPQKGSILLNGIEQELFHNKDWQSLVGYVPQESLLLDCSILENIAFGIPKNEIKLEFLWECVKIAAIDSFLDSMPHGLDTQVGDKGIKLSGGQKQRISIARALYTQPKVLIFDEATSALDSITQEEISQAIERLSHTMALVIIAHRIQTVKNADMIFMFDNGSIVARGTYDELYAKSVKFQQLAGL